MPIEFTRVNNDGNGNPRYVCHFLAFCVPSDNERFTGLDFISRKYDLALSRSREFGGRKFHNKQYGGGIVFTSYNIGALGEKIEAFVASIKRMMADTDLEAMEQSEAERLTAAGIEF